MPKTSKKHSHKQGTGNERASTRADQEVTTLNGESAKQLMVREILISKPFSSLKVSSRLQKDSDFVFSSTTWNRNTIKFSI